MYAYLHPASVHVYTTRVTCDFYGNTASGGQVCIRKITLNALLLLHLVFSLYPPLSLSLFLDFSVSLNLWRTNLFSVSAKRVNTLAVSTGPIILQRNCCPASLVSLVSRLNPRGTRADFTRHGAIRDARGGTRESTFVQPGDCLIFEQLQRIVNRS